MTDARVAHLRLTATDDAHVRRGAILVEDAMRTATLAPDFDRRAYIVRHLDVGVIDPDAPPQTLALQIERRLAHIQLTAVPATSADAATARAVWFADEPTAIAELARRLAHGRPSEWFWRHVAGGAVTLPSADHALRTCIQFAASRPAGPLALAALIDAVETTREGALLGLLQPSDGEALCRMTFGTAAIAGLPSELPDVIAILQPRWHARLARWISHWGADARALWLAAIASIASRGSIGSLESELARARQLVAAIIARLARHELAPDARDIHSPDAGDVPVIAPMTASANEAASEHVEVPLVEEAIIESAAAGALFLIRPLAMLGIADWLEDHPWTSAVNWPAQLLATIVARFAGPDDPLALALCSEPLHDGPFSVPARWRSLVGCRPHRLRAVRDGGRVLEAFGRLPLAAWRDVRPDLDGWRDHPIRRGPPAPSRAWAAFAWERALDRWLRTFASLRIANVVCRTATLTATPTHIDLVMPLRSADPQIRRAGLDVDPGWVPWLGRIVQFHYRGACG